MEKVYMSEIRSTFIAGAASVVVVVRSADSEMRKGTKNNRNPLLGRVMLRRTYSGYALGTDYRNQVVDAANKCGNDKPVVNLKPVWHKPAVGFEGWFVTDQNESRYYLHLGRNEKRVGYKTETEWFVDGHAATEAEMYLIQSWLSAKANGLSSTQKEVGIDKAHKVEFLAPALDTIICIKQKDRVWMPTEKATSDVLVAVAADTH